MEYGGHGLADQVRRELQESYRRHGCGPEFWNAYQRVLTRLVPEGVTRTRVTNEMALMIEELGVVRRAQLVPATGSEEQPPRTQGQ